jgi:chromosome segregation ATPase
MCGSDPLRRVAAALLLCGALVDLAAAQTVNREQEQLHRLRQQLQQLQQEQTAAAAQAQKLSADNTALQQRLKQVDSGGGNNRARLAAATQHAEALAAELNRLKSEQSTLTTQLAESRTAQAKSLSELTEANADLMRVQKALVMRESGLNQLSTQFQALDTRYTLCTAQNGALVDLGREVIARYANRGVDEMFTLREPFVQTQRVALENLVLSYRERLDAQTHSSKSAPR